MGKDMARKRFQGVVTLAEVFLEFVLEPWTIKYEVLGDLQPEELVANSGLLGALWGLAPNMSFKSVDVQTALREVLHRNAAKWRLGEKAGHNFVKVVSARIRHMCRHLAQACRGKRSKWPTWARGHFYSDGGGGGEVGDAPALQDSQVAPALQDSPVGEGTQIVPATGAQFVPKKNMELKLFQRRARRTSTTWVTRASRSGVAAVRACQSGPRKWRCPRAGHWQRRSQLGRTVGRRPSLGS